MKSFLSGKKTYVVLIGGVVIAWLGYLSGANLSCEWQDAAEVCNPLSMGDAINATWLAVSGVMMRLGIAKFGS